jgi:two-component system phosphate regulon sensor histidine kinase PhoR
MFPDQLLSQPTFLHVHFPQKVGFLLRSMWIRLGTSVLFILLITGCFAFVVWTIFRQKKLSDMKNDFINNMTHELKTPIATLSLAGQAIGDPGMGKDAGRLSRFGGMIREESAKLGAHVERILQIAVIDQGDMKLAVDPVDVHDVVSRLATAYHLRLQRPDDSLVTSLRAEHSIVRGDPMHISNMIDNLLDNAVKYSKPDRIDVVVSTRNEGDTLVLEVTDQGVGMKKDTTKRIFEKFYRVPTGNVHNIKGFGLGLSYVKYVVEAHQGTISVKSSPDHGSTFKITIPI